MNVASIQIIVNGKPTEVEATSSLVDLLDQLGLPSRGIAIEVNQALITRADHAAFRLQENDQLEIVSLAGGG